MGLTNSNIPLDTSRLLFFLFGNLPLLGCKEKNALSLKADVILSFLLVLMPSSDNTTSSSHYASGCFMIVSPAVVFSSNYTTGW